MSKRRQDDFYQNINLNVRGLGQSATLAINEESNKLRRRGKTVYKLGLGQSPFPVPEHVVEALRQNAHQKDYLPVLGLHELRTAISKCQKQNQGLDYHHQNIIVGPGSKELIFILQLAYYGDLIIPTPSWVSYSPQAQIVGRNVHWVPTKAEKGYKLTPERLDLICRSDPKRPRIAILNYPSNPTGCSFSADELGELAKVARKYKVILVSDEIYGLTSHNGIHKSIAHYYPEGTIVSSGLSKWCGAGGWRLGFFAVPENLRWLLLGMKTVASETFTATSAPIQYAAVTAFSGGSEMEKYLFHTRRILKAIANEMGKKFDELNITYPKPDGAFYFFVNFEHYRENLKKRKIYTSSELCKALIKDTGVAILPGSDFGRQPEELSARIAYVDFDGTATLNNSFALKNRKTLNGEFVNQNCRKLLDAVDIMGNWLQKKK